MTEEYWRRYKRDFDNEVFNKNPLWQDVQADLKRQYPGKKHPLELYNICKSENVYIRQIKNSPNITYDTVAELICRPQACDLQYCLSMLEPATRNKNKGINLNGCRSEYSDFTSCMVTEKNKVMQVELELKNKLENKQPEIKTTQKQSKIEIIN